jgi:hypothetical protein
MKAERAEAATKELLIKLALGRGAWSDALEQIDQELQGGRLDPVKLKLDKVKVLCAFHRLPEASRLLEDLLQEGNLGPHMGSALLWKADIKLASSPLNDCSADLVEARKEGLPHAEEFYAQALLAPTMAEVIGALERAVEREPLAQRAIALLGMNYLLLGEEKKARERIAYGETFFPNDPNFRVLRMLLETREGNPDAANAAAKWLENQGTLSKQELDAAFAQRGYMQQLINLEAHYAGNPKQPLLAVALDMDKYAKQVQAQLANGGGTALPLPPLYLKVWDGERLKKIQSALTGFSKRQDQEEASDELTRMTAVHPDAFLYFMQGLVLFQLERYADAEKAFLTAVNAKSFFRIQRAALTAAVGSKILQAVEPPGGNPELVAKALRQMRELVATGDVSPDFAEGLAAFALRANEVELARQVISSWEQQEPKNKKVRLYRAKAELRGGAYGSVLEIAKEFSKEDPQYDEVNELQKQARQEVERLAESLRKVP